MSQESDRNVEDRPARQPILNVPDLNMQALLREMERLLDRRLNPIEDRLFQVEVNGQRERAPEGVRPRRERPNQNRGRRRVQDDEANDLSDLESEQESNASDRRRQHRQRDRRRDDDDLKNIKLTIPPFQGGDEATIYPAYYHRSCTKTQNLTQGSKSVEDYYKEMEIAMIRRMSKKIPKQRWRDSGGLNRDIANVVELQHYIEVVDMVHMAIKVERQLKRKGPSRGFPLPTLQGGAKDQAKDPPILEGRRPRYLQNQQAHREMNKGKAPESSYNRNRDIKCFKCLERGHIASQCPNRRTMVLRADGKIEIEDEEEKESESASEVEEDVEQPMEGELLVVKRSLSLQGAENDLQRENIFHTRCQHPSPYKLQWLNDGGELKVTKQVLVSFNIDKYSDEVLCDVVPMHAGHLLLGRPWQFDRRVQHDGYANRISKTFFGRNPSGLPPLRGIEHQIDFMPGAVIPNRPAYRANPEETKELQRQVNELMEKGYIRESLSPCAVPVLLVPKKDGTWHICEEKEDFVKDLHNKVRANIEARIESYVRNANKGQKQ
ncbi:uncharacterized protein LOC108468222 [Gossypium arboreum]|uniref:uncharacterized protein LOC108468222 n=1 Tax=Gossypium arboreum TaxID=29729 RepID=UPI0022F1BEB6|nr:uncharacterized protein LOC108468222 [Gossypium arboreum]